MRAGDGEGNGASLIIGDTASERQMKVSMHNDYLTAIVALIFLALMVVTGCGCGRSGYLISIYFLK